MQKLRIFIQQTCECHDSCWPSCMAIKTQDQKSSKSACDIKYILYVLTEPRNVKDRY
jgi:hypothetical protein